MTLKKAVRGVVAACEHRASRIVLRVLLSASGVTDTSSESKSLVVTVVVIAIVIAVVKAVVTNLGDRHF